MHELLILSPGKLAIAIANYAVIHLLWTLIKNHYKGWITRSERNIAIWTHYQLRALGKGHQSKLVAHCDQQSCQIFQQPVV